MSAIRLIAIILTAILTILMVFFMNGLSWEDQKEKKSIIGFMMIIGVLLLDILMLCFSR